QLGLQMAQLKIQLALGNDQRPGMPPPGDLGSVERIPSSTGLVMDRPQIGRNRRQRRSALAELINLRVRAIPSRLPLQHLLSKQGFPPKGDQALLIQKGRMKGPKTHPSSGRNRRTETRPLV